MYGWCVCLFVKEGHRYKFGIFYHLGRLLLKIQIAVLCCKKLSKTRKILQEPFVFPMRVIFSAIFAFATAFMGMLYVRYIQNIMMFYKVYGLLDTLDKYRLFLEDESHDTIFAVLNYYGVYKITVGNAITIIEWCIKLLTPVFPSLLAGYVLGMILVLFTIWTMFYKFKSYVIFLRNAPSNSVELKWLWNFPPHSAIYFPGDFYSGQFIFNCVFLQSLIVMIVFGGCYGICLLYFINIDYLQLIRSQKSIFWVSFIPLLIR